MYVPQVPLLSHHYPYIGPKRRGNHASVSCMFPSSAIFSHMSDRLDMIALETVVQRVRQHADPMQQHEQAKAPGPWKGPAVLRVFGDVYKEEQGFWSRAEEAGGLVKSSKALEGVETWRHVRRSGLHNGVEPTGDQPQAPPLCTKRQSFQAECRLYPFLPRFGHDESTSDSCFRVVA